MQQDIVEQLKSSYSDNERSFILKTNKETAIHRLREIEREIMALPDFDSFPEGANGVILYCMLKAEAQQCPDLGDFSYRRQGYEKMVQVSFEVIATETSWI
jgi:hypothetical protein